MSRNVNSKAKQQGSAVRPPASRPSAPRPSAPPPPPAPPAQPEQPVQPVQPAQSVQSIQSLAPLKAWSPQDFTPQLDTLERMLNEVLLETGKTLKGARKSSGSNVTQVANVINSRTKLQYNTFQDAIGEIEFEIKQAKAVLIRDLDRVKARGGPPPPSPSPVAVAATAPPSEAAAIATPPAADEQTAASTTIAESPGLFLTSDTPATISGTGATNAPKAPPTAAPFPDMGGGMMMPMPMAPMAAMGLDIGMDLDLSPSLNPGTMVAPTAQMTSSAVPSQTAMPSASSAAHTVRPGGSKPGTATPAPKPSVPGVAIAAAKQGGVAGAPNYTNIQFTLAAPSTGNLAQSGVQASQAALAGSGTSGTGAAEDDGSNTIPGAAIPGKKPGSSNGSPTLPVLNPAAAVRSDGQADMNISEDALGDLYYDDESGVEKWPV